MIQIIEKVMEKKGHKSEQIECEEQLGELNPRYFEEGMTPEKALDKVHAANFPNNLIRPF